MNSTPRTRQAAIDRIKSYLSSYDFSKEEEKSLIDVLDVLEDTKVCFDLFRSIADIGGMHDFQNYHTNLDGDEDDYLVLLSEAFALITTRNLY